MKAYISRRRALLVAYLAVLLIGCGLLVGCNRGGSGKVKVCYLGLTCENPIFAAYEFGFFKEANPKFRPVETDRAGIFVCGMAQSPQNMAEAIAQAEAAAGRAAAILSRKSLTPNAITSTVSDRWCVGCEMCITVCPVHARVIDAETKKAKVYGELCVACGACATVCPSSAAKSTAANDRQVLSTIEILTSD